MGKAKGSDLTDKQEMFCREYVIDFNGTQAAIRSGYSKNSAKVIGAQHLTKLNVQNFIKDLTLKKAERCEITADMVLSELASIGFSKITDYLKVEEVVREIDNFDFSEDDGVPNEPLKVKSQSVIIFNTHNIHKSKIPAIAEIKMTRDGISLKLHDKIKALESIAKHIGFFEKDNEQQQAGSIPSIIIHTDGPKLSPTEGDVDTNKTK